MLFSHLRSYILFSANTDVGKTVFATALIRAAANNPPNSAAAAGPQPHVHYLKPLSTGPARDADYSHVQRYSGPGGRFVTTACLYQLDEPVSPHLAVRMAGLDIASPAYSHAEFTRRVSNHISTTASASPSGSFLFLETAGGVHSPTLSGLSQADAYRQFRPPTILIGDSRLGGISTTLASYEALLIRGYSIDAVLLFHDAYYNNHEYIANHFARNAKGTLVQTIPRPPCRLLDVPDGTQDEAAMEAYYASICDSPSDSASILQNISGTGAIPAILSHIKCRHNERITSLASMPERTLASVWWPFVQHANIPGARESHRGVTVIDSAFGDFLEASGPGSPSPSLGSAIPTRVEEKDNPRHTPLLSRQFDGSASWWTQAIGHANSQLTLAAAHAAGRYGHVIFPLATHEPALALAERLLVKGGPGQGWAHKVFFSDDGSTGMEVALKMAMRASALRYPAPSSPSSPSEKRELHILGISGSYHGDTIGAMDACEGGAYNSAVEWHRERGFWFDPPRVGVRDGGQVTVSIPAASWSLDLDLKGTETEFAKWTVGGPAPPGDDRVGSSTAGRTLTTTVTRGDDRTLRVGFSGGPSLMPDALQYVYDIPQRFARSDPLIAVYTKYITTVLERLVIQEKRSFGALVLEPILMGAGGMVWVDPLFQRVLIDVVRAREDLWSHVSGNIVKPDGTLISWCGLPVIFDEVFVGLYRLGFLSSSSILGTFPDISVLAKILTGGLVPMSVTLASNSIYDAFLGPEKKDALLHGHSYTAHPIGCAVAGKTLDIIGEISSGEGNCGQEWTNAKVRWMATTSASPSPLSESASASRQPVPGSQNSTGKEGTWSLWDPGFVAALSRCDAVDEVMSLGTVLAIQLRDDTAAGYQASSSQAFLEGVLSTLTLRADEESGNAMGLHFRPLGNVAYLMTSLDTPRSTIQALQGAILHSLAR